MKPIDFIDNTHCQEIFFCQLELRTAQIGDISYSLSYYDRNKDPKWVIFARKHKLSKKDRKNPKWFDLYLRLCAEGII